MTTGGRLFLNGCRVLQGRDSGLLVREEGEDLLDRAADQGCLEGLLEDRQIG